MLLTKAEIEAAIVEWRKLYFWECPLCQGKEVTIEAMVALQGTDGENVIPGLIFRVVPIVCRSCGYTVLVADSALKLLHPMNQSKRAI